MEKDDKKCIGYHGFVPMDLDDNDDDMSVGRVAAIRWPQVSRLLLEDSQRSLQSHTAASSPEMVTVHAKACQKQYLQLKGNIR